MIDVNDADRKFLGFNLAARLDDYEAEIKKSERKGYDVSGAREQWRRLEELIYTKVIPESWSGPKPSYWKER